MSSVLTLEVQEIPLCTLQFTVSFLCFDSVHYGETEKGLFSQCLDKLVTGGIAKPYLASYMGGTVDVKLNDGRCKVEEQEMFFYFRASRKASECGTERRVSEATEKTCIMKCLCVCVSCILLVCDWPGEQNPHRVPKHADCGPEQRANHQPAGPKDRVEVCLPASLCSHHSGWCGHGVVRRTSYLSV